MQQPWLRRLTRGGALLLALASAAPAAQADFLPEQDLTQAVSAPAPQTVAGNIDPAEDYRALQAELTALGLTQGEADALWARRGSTLLEELQDGTLPADWTWQAQPNYQPDRAARYQAAQGETPAETVLRVNLDLDLTPYDDAVPAEAADSPLVLVNKYHGLAQDYVPPLETLGTQYGRGALRPEAARAFRAMADGARAEGIRLNSVSAYRSYETQTALYHSYCQKYGQTRADTFSARPGFSEHQTGLAVDINTASLSAHFERTKEYAWLQAHCAEYGFMLRYRQGQEDITGYCCEPWHYRYVGREIARYCMDNQLTYEEYLARQTTGDNAAPRLWLGGQALSLGHGAQVWGGSLYLSAQSLAEALGWSVSAAPGTGDTVLYTAGPTVRLFRGNYCLADDTPVLLSAPSAALDGDWYLTLDDWAALLGWTVRQEEIGLVLE